MSAAKWENRFHKQVEANNMLSDRLRETRSIGQHMIDELKEAYLSSQAEIKDLKYSIQLLETALIKEVPDEVPE